MIAIAMDVGDKEVIILGGGRIAFQKGKRYVEQNARVTVYSNQFDERWSTLSGNVNYVQQKISPEMNLPRAFLYVCAISDEVYADWLLTTYGVTSNIINVCHGEYSNCMHMKTIQQGPFLVGVSSRGASPYLTNFIGQQVQQLLAQYTDEELDFLIEARKLIRVLECSEEEKRSLHEEAISHLKSETTVQQTYLSSLKAFEK